ncbi:hypothetical protein V5799_033058 [Amblyomma americanum]|uniref:Hexosyltransferase n=1 Tax=Amblyomma americanum TaxID=6943 RepID=A0AAQ4DPE4_AMBAM
MRWHVRQRDIIPHVVGARPFLMLPPAACPRYLAIVVCSALSHFEARATVRDTWGRDAAAKNVSVLFIVGKPEDKPSGRAIGESLKNESARYRDVIQADFRDSYRNLTLKTVLLLKWAYVHCSRTRFIFKADDDVFVNVENLLNFLKTIVRGTECARREEFQPNWFFRIFCVKFASKNHPDTVSVACSVRAPAANRICRLLTPVAQPSGRVLQERVANESARYGDVIQAAFRDSYRNLTLKTVFLLKWAYMHCSSTRFVMKADDDVFVNVNNLLRFLRAHSNSERRAR